VESIFCCITYPGTDGLQHDGARVFAAANALRLSEVDWRDFGTARRFREDKILVVALGMVPHRCCCFRIGSVRQWEAEVQRWCRLPTIIIAIGFGMRRKVLHNTPLKQITLASQHFADRV
jgi:hypothetical protein